MNEWISSYEKLKGEKIILTTEKDAARIKLHKEFLKKHGEKIFVLPIEVKILFDEEKLFDKLIFDFVSKAKGE